MIKKIIIFFVIILLIVIGAYLAYMWFESTAYNYQPIVQSPEPAVPEQTPDLTVGWEVLANNEFGFELKYPNGFFDENQQPKILIGDCNYGVFPGQCPDINDIVAQDMASSGGDINAIKNNLSGPGYWDVIGQQQEINNTQYCLYATGGAAAGRAFNYYYYATVRGERCFVIYLTIATENCDFYLPFESGDTEQADKYNNCLSVNAEQPLLFNKIISTFKFK